MLPTPTPGPRLWDGYLLPIEQQIWKTSTETIGRILATDKIPALEGFRSYSPNQERQGPHISPLRHIYRRLHQRCGITITEQETIPPYIVPPWWQGPSISIASDAEMAKTQHKNFLKHPSNSIFIYTDGSGIDNHIGAAAISPVTRCTKMAYMGNSETSTVYAAELQGIKLALQIAVQDQEIGNKRNKVVIFTDNQAAIRTLQHPAGRSGAYIAIEAVALIDKLQKNHGIQVEIRWIPAHIGIWGNEAADKAAKFAAKSQSEGNRGNPNVVQPKTYHLQATLKTWIMRQTRAEWAYKWDLEPRGRATYKYTQKPTHKILHLHRRLKKWQSSLLIQMRTEKIGLRDFLWKRKVPGYNDPGCECGEGRQTVEHIVLRCRKFKDLRQREFGGGRWLDLKAILTESKTAIKVIRFMEQTQLLGQFRSCSTVQRDEAERWGETEGIRT
ncbi:hypothetical protein HYALB_00011658 [Hymenoscyphus albidus]|uniref:RNase H type-1 domain-containing protein n=1 Tax=Hymenoscyphus albidus TaxID=595503 RepID=A0A9N9Q7W2_9HELO|nr:hypothetical protein HYALB_00011658 [Hymenoscyphus albidus]